MNDRTDSRQGRYQILKSVVIVEYAEGLINRINPLPAECQSLHQERKIKYGNYNLERKLALLLIGEVHE